MEWPEIKHILIALIIFTIIASFNDVLQNGPGKIIIYLGFVALILLVNIGAKKLAANALDSDVEHELWTMQRFGYKPTQHINNPAPTGIIVPVVVSLFTLGLVKFPTLLTYEARALKQRASKRFGFYSFTEMTDWHNALIGSAGIIAVLILAGIAYFPGLEGLAKLSAFYALVNMIPFSKLDGMQIAMGSRPLYAGLLVLTLIFFGYALVL